MVQSSWISPFAQIGRELRIDLRMSFQESRLAALGRRVRTPEVPLLPEQRIDDQQLVARREAEHFLQSVRLGAVRR